MPQIIQVEALPRQGISFTFTPSYRKNRDGGVLVDEKKPDDEIVLDTSRGRGWPSGELLTVEVLDQEEDGPLVVTEVLDRSQNRMVKRFVPDMEHIGRRTFEALKENSFVRILSDGGTTNQEASRAVDIARAQVAESAKKVFDLETEVSRLKDENKTLKAQLADAQASLQVALAPAAPKVDDKPPKPRKGA